MRIRSREVEISHGCKMAMPTNRIDLFLAGPLGDLVIWFMHRLMKSRGSFGRVASISYRFVACEVRGAMCAS